ncbi:electron transfer flavoprotein subunit beta/FixA family protein [Microbacterium sp.]|uniref:electron transfer flavoprotein subunit beta/FixA family protein n=1 Tax=Microbacterium sp. TaxID=51671 RepID=UPI002C904E5B|nr:electron transfer flavoprotein subunit beta/FixA family protein [Microbacterium sp.]HWL77996.1 electron transfer flavoprotein subunit beta/FixA family protein [Microbacterium sp.]
MRIIVLVKDVPDTYGDRKLDPETGLADRVAGDHVIDEIDERALEVALAYADGAPDTEVIVLSMAPEPASASLRKALSMGASAAVHIVDDELVGADLGLTAEALAAAARRAEADLIVAGNVSTDGSGGVIPAMVAELLGVPHLTALSAVQIRADGVSGTRATESGTADVSAGLPAVVSVTEALPEARFPNFKGIMAAKKKPFETVSLADLGVTALDPATPRAIMIAVAERPPRVSGVKLTDDGEAGARIAEYLVTNRLA